VVEVASASDSSVDDAETVTIVDSDDGVNLHEQFSITAQKGFHHEHSFWSRLLVEDVMFLQPKAEILILVRISIDDATPHCKNYNQLAKLCDQQPFDYPFVTFRHYDYFQIHGVVNKNIYRQKLLGGYWGQKDVYDHVHGNQRGCFNATFFGKQETTQVNLYWCDVLSKTIIVFSLPPFHKPRDFYPVAKERDKTLRHFCNF